MAGTYQTYSEYKDSGVKWLDAIPADWVVSKVKHLTDFQVGWTPPTKVDANFIGDNLWANISDLRSKYIDCTGKNISDEAAKTASMEITPKGSLLYSFKLSVGAVSFARQNMYTNEAIASFLEGGLLPLSYMYYALPKFVIENASTNIYGARILNQELINNALLLKPSYAEAEKIATFLDHETACIDILIEKQQQLIKLLKEKRQAVISHAVTKGLNPTAPMRDSGVEWLGEVPEHWAVLPIKYIVSIPVTDGPHETPNFLEEGVPFISAEAVSSGQINFEKIRAHISDEDDKRYSLKYSPEKYDIYMVKSGATTGVTAIVETDDKFNIWSPLAVIRCNADSSPYFVLNFMRSYNFKEAVELNWSFGTQQNIGMGVIENLHVTRPPAAEAKLISEKLAKQCRVFDSVINKASSQIAVLQERHTALISAAVTGKIDVRNWQAPQPSNKSNNNTGK